MATKIRLDLDSEGIQEILRSPEVERELRRRADRVSAAAGPGHVTTTWQGFDRVRAKVATTTARAAREEAINRTLSKALDAARGG